jgi:hypothetical protein
MYFIYKSSAEIDEYGDVMFEIEGEEQMFSFRAGISDMVLPTFFSNLTALLNREIQSFEVDGNEAMAYYKFKRNGNKLRIETKHWHVREICEFSLHNFCKALQTAFKKFFRQQRINGEEEATQGILNEWSIFDKVISMTY